MKLKILSREEKEKLEIIYYRYLNDDLIARMKDIPMHNGSNCYLHSFKVAKRAIYVALKKDKNLDLESIMVASILHDYYLYDWRSDKSLLKGHGKKHPMIAINNAKRDFEINDKVTSIIETHMWPINIKKYPKSKEAKIVLNADNYVACREMFTSKRYKAKRIEKTINYISTLFD